MIAFHRSPNDLGRIAANEIAGIEPRGTIELIISSARGDVAPSNADATASALLRLAESLKSPDLVRKQINDLSVAAAEGKAAADSVRAEQRKLDRAKQELDAERAAHQAVIDKERSEHEAAMKVANAELASIKKLAAELESKARADAAAASEMKARLQKKLQLIEAA